MKYTRFILVLLLSTIMVEHIYCKSYEDEVDYFDLDDYEENSDDYLDFEPEDIEEEGDFTSMHNRPHVYREQKTTPEEKAKKSKCYKECGAYFLKRGKAFEDGKTCFDSCMTTLIEDIEKGIAPSPSASSAKKTNGAFVSGGMTINTIRCYSDCEDNTPSFCQNINDQNYKKTSKKKKNTCADSCDTNYCG